MNRINPRSSDANSHNQSIVSRDLEDLQNETGNRTSVIVLEPTQNYASVDRLSLKYATLS